MALSTDPAKSDVYTNGILQSSVCSTEEGKCTFCATCTKSAILWSIILIVCLSIIKFLSFDGIVTVFVRLSVCLCWLDNCLDNFSGIFFWVADHQPRRRPESMSWIWIRIIYTQLLYWVSDSIQFPRGQHHSWWRSVLSQHWFSSCKLC